MAHDYVLCKSEIGAVKVAERNETYLEFVVHWVCDVLGKLDSRWVENR